MEIRNLGPYDHNQVRAYLPHRYPFLFVDKILGLEVPYDDQGKPVAVGTKVRGLKNASGNEPFFVGHFPDFPITPGVVLIECMAQVAAFAVLPHVEVDANLKVTSQFALRLAGVDEIRFRRPFLPGDSLVMTMECIKHRGPIWQFKGRGEVDGNLILEGQVMASVVMGAKL